MKALQLPRTTVLSSVPVVMLSQCEMEHLWTLTLWRSRDPFVSARWSQTVVPLLSAARMDAPGPLSISCLLMIDPQCVSALHLPDEVMGQIAMMTTPRMVVGGVHPQGGKNITKLFLFYDY